jgi:hypothetical protein
VDQIGGKPLKVESPDSFARAVAAITRVTDKQNMNAKYDYFHETAL